MNPIWVHLRTLMNIQTGCSADIPIPVNLAVFTLWRCVAPLQHFMQESWLTHWLGQLVAHTNTDIMSLTRQGPYKIYSLHLNVLMKHALSTWAAYCPVVSTKGDRHQRWRPSSFPKMAFALLSGSGGRGPFWTGENITQPQDPWRWKPVMNLPAHKIESAALTRSVPRPHSLQQLQHRGEGITEGERV